MKTNSPFFLVSGPCVIEDEAVTLRIATRLKALTDSLGIPFTFKASYDKANRTAITSFRGPGIQDGLRVLANIKETLDVPILSDVHRISEVAAAALQRLAAPAAFDTDTFLGGKAQLMGLRLDHDCPVVNTPLRQLSDLFSTLRVVVLAVRAIGVVLRLNRGVVIGSLDY